MLRVFCLILMFPCLASCNQATTLTSTTNSQDDGELVADEPLPEVTAMDYQRLLEEWEAADTTQRAMSKAIQVGGGDRREKQKQLMELRDKTLNRTFPQFAQSAILAYANATDDKPEIEKKLVEIAEIAYALDRYETALEAAEMLIADETSAKSMYDVAGAAAFCTDDFEKAKKYMDLAGEKGSLRRAAKFRAEVSDYIDYWKTEKAIREKEAAADDLPRVVMKTTAGDMVIELYENEAPQTVGNFVSLVEKGYYDGLTFHRVLPGFMAQGGDPTGTGGGGPGYTIFCECEKPGARMHFQGTLSMAKTNLPNTGGSQFFLTFLPTSHLNRKHTVFGRVIEGKDVLPKINRINPGEGGKVEKIIEAKVIRKRDHEYKPTKSS